MTITITKFPSVKEVSYEQLRPDIKTGDILLCSGTGFFSKLIQTATKSIWSHVAFIIRLDSIDRVMVLESLEPQGIRTVPLSFYANNWEGSNKGYAGRVLVARHSEFPSVSAAKITEMTKFSVDLFGYAYDKEEVMRIASRICKSLLGFSDNEVVRNREYICSEYAWEVYNSIDINIPYDKRNFIAPKDFAKCKGVKAVAEVGIER